MCLVPFRSSLCVVAIALLFSGCAGYPPIKPFFSHGGGAGPRPPTLEWPWLGRGDYWNDHGGGGAPSIVVRLGEQRGYFYRGRQVVGATRISSGKSGFGTPAGSYRVIQKDRHHVSTLYGDYVNGRGEVVKANVGVHRHSAPRGSRFRGAKMPYFLRFSGGHGLHAGRVPDHPASHGCVRLPATMARHFFESSTIGTPVRVEH